MIELATYVAVNDYEAKLLSNKTGWSIEEMPSRVRSARRLRSANTVRRFCTRTVSKNSSRDGAAKSLDPTGCGDAFRGGLLYGIENKLGWAIPVVSPA